MSVNRLWDRVNALPEELGCTKRDISRRLGHAGDSFWRTGDEDKDHYLSTIIHMGQKLELIPVVLWEAENPTKLYGCIYTREDASTFLKNRREERGLTMVSLVLTMLRIACFPRKGDRFSNLP